MNGAEKQSADWSEVAAAYQRAIRSFDEFTQPILKQFGVPHLGLSNIIFLINIGDDGSRRIADLVKEQRYVGSNASYALSMLISAGLVERDSDLQDKRIRVVRATKAGRKLLDAIRRASKGDDGAIADALKTISIFESHVAVLPAEAAE